MTTNAIPNRIKMVPIPEPRIGAPGIYTIAAPTITKIIPSTARIVACMFLLFAVFSSPFIFKASIVHIVSNHK